MLLTVVGSGGLGHAYEIVAVADGGTVRGTIRYYGDVPTPARIAVTKDPEVCGHEKVAGDLVVSSTAKGIKNVVVRLRDVARGKPLPKQKTVRLRQKACEYSPRVAIFPAGSRVRIENEDGILHNTNTRSEINRSFTVAQPGFRRIFEKRIEEPEMPIRIRCDVHSWMTAWWIAQEHPYYDLTDAEGSFALTDVPPGKYTLEAWHETLGTVTQSVTVQPAGIVEVMLDLPPH
jgi:hypothetical protein